MFYSVLLFLNLFEYFNMKDSAASRYRIGSRVFCSRSLVFLCVKYFMMVGVICFWIYFIMGSMMCCLVLYVLCLYFFCMNKFMDVGRVGSFSVLVSFVTRMVSSKFWECENGIMVFLFLCIISIGYFIFVRFFWLFYLLVSK